MPEREPEETTDPEDVREWADRRDLVPARRTDADELALVAESDVESDESVARIDWDEFASTFERRDATFRYPEAGGEPADADGTAAADPAEEGATLEEGETARTEVTETRTVEQEVVTTATVETEVVDEEVVSEEVVDTELLDREVIDCTVDESGESVELDLRERTRFTTEVERRDLVESRVVDADADAVDGDDGAEAVEREVDTERGEALVDGERVARELGGTEADAREEADVDAAAVADGETELGERTERRTVETEVVGRYRVRAEVTERERVDEEVVEEAITETELVDGVGEGRSEGAARDAAEEGTGADADADVEPAHDPTDETVWVDDSHEGDAVVAADGETVGRIAGVDGLTIRVDADPDAADRFDGDGGTTIRQDQVDEVSGGAVRVSGLRDE